VTHLLRTVLDTAGIAGWVWLSALASSAVVSVAVIVVVARARVPAGSGLFIVSGSAALGGLGAAWAATIALANWARRSVLRQPPHELVFTFMPEVDLVAVTLGSIALFVLTLLAFGACGVAWSRVARPQAAAWVVAASLTTPIALALVRVLGWANDARAAIEAASRTWNTGGTLTAAMLDAHGRWLDAHGLLFASGAIAAVVGAAAVIAARRAGGRSGWAPSLGATVLFASGVAAFASTRGHAADATVVLPAHPLHDFDLERLPHPRACAATLDIGPILVVDPAGTRLDGRHVTMEQLRQDLETMRRNWSILHPARADEPGPVLLVTPSGTPLGPLEQHLDAMTGAGFTRLAVVARTKRSIETRTRGRIEETFACSLSVGLGGENAVSTRDIATVDDLVERAQREPDLAIAPPIARP